MWPYVRTTMVSFFFRETINVQNKLARSAEYHHEQTSHLSSQKAPKNPKIVVICLVWVYEIRDNWRPPGSGSERQVDVEEAEAVPAGKRPESMKRGKSFERTRRRQWMCCSVLGGAYSIVFIAIASLFGCVYNALISSVWKWKTCWTGWGA